MRTIRSIQGFIQKHRCVRELNTKAAQFKVTKLTPSTTPRKANTLFRMLNNEDQHTQLHYNKMSHYVKTL